MNSCPTDNAFLKKQASLWIVLFSSFILETDVEVKLQVLQTNRLVDVKQEEPYGDVSLKLAATPSNDQSWYAGPCVYR